MTIHIDNLSVYCIIGLLNFEREKEQCVIINFKAEYEYTEGDFVDYSVIVEIIEHHLKEKRYTLLESALLGLKSTILNAHPMLRTLHIQLDKPDIFNHCSVGISETWDNAPQR